MKVVEQHERTCTHPKGVAKTLAQATSPCKPLSEDRGDPVLGCGLDNQGATCYVNSFLQAGPISVHCIEIKCDMILKCSCHVRFALEDIPQPIHCSK